MFLTPYIVALHLQLVRLSQTNQMRDELHSVLVKVHVLVHDAVHDQETVRPVDHKGCTKLSLNHFEVGLLVWKVVCIVENRSQSVAVGVGAGEAHVALGVAGVIRSPVGHGGASNRNLKLESVMFVRYLEL